MAAGGLIGALRVTLGLDSAAFERGADRARRETSNLSKGMAVAAGAAKGLAGGLVAAFSVDAIVGAAKAGLEYASSLGEVSAQLGVTAKDLQEYRYAASQAGIEQGEMDAALAKLTRTIGMAASGSKKQAEAFAALGISIRDANGHVRSAGDLIPEIAEALQNIDNPAERAAMLVDLFGKAGQKLAPLLADGAAGVNGLRDAAQKLGLVLSDEQIQKADDTADKLSALKQVLEAKIAGAVSDNAESILAFADALVKLVTWLGKAAVAWRNFHIEAKIATEEDRINRFFMSADERLRSAERVANMRQQQLDSLYPRNPNPAPAAQRNKGKPTRSMLTPVRGVGGALGGAGVAALAGLDVSMAVKQAMAVVDGVGKEFDRLPLLVQRPTGLAMSLFSKELREAKEELVERTQDLIDSLFPEEAAIEDLKAKLELLDKALAEKLITDQVWLEARARLIVQLEAMRGDIEEARIKIVDEIPSLEDFEPLSDDVKKALGIPVEETTQKVGDDFATMAQRVSGSLQDMIYAIKDGNFLDIFSTILGVLAQIGQATGGFSVGPLKFPGAPNTSGIPGFARGGSFRVGGVGGIDKNLVTMRLSRGEMVDITPAGGQRGGTKVFDMRGAVVTADLLAQVNGMIAAGEARAVTGGAALALQRSARMQSRRLG